MQTNQPTLPLPMQLAIPPEIDLEALSADVEAACRNYDPAVQHRSDLQTDGPFGAYSYSDCRGSTKSGKDDDLRPDD
jgi:hypothetical protein